MIWYSGNIYSAWYGHAIHIAAAEQQVSLLNNLLRVNAPPWFVPQGFDNGKIESVAGRGELIFCEAGLVFSSEFKVRSSKSGSPVLWRYLNLIGFKDLWGFKDLAGFINLAGFIDLAGLK
jgi:hypothetical protein